MLLDEIARSERYGNPLSCVLLTVQGLGRVRGDARLRVGSRLADVMRKTDRAAVWGNEAFLLVLPETKESGAMGLAGKLERALAELGSELNADGSGRISVSTRATTLRTGDDVDGILRRLTADSPL